MCSTGATEDFQRVEVAASARIEHNAFLKKLLPRETTPCTVIQKPSWRFLIFIDEYLVWMHRKRGIFRCRNHGRLKIINRMTGVNRFTGRSGLSIA
jgi:hypothetical protein